MQYITPTADWPLHNVAQTKALEQAAAAKLPPHTLMQRAGLATAKLALAIAPHAQRIWLACGAGNNGGDGLQAAYHLRQWGKDCLITWLGNPEQASTDTLASYQQLLTAGMTTAQQIDGTFDLCIDALLGIGSQLRAPHGLLAQTMQQINSSSAPVLAIDTPSGLHADSGQITAPCVVASHTLSLLTLKPGLFTNHGRDHAGKIWFDALGTNSAALASMQPAARLNAKPQPQPRAHASHKGSYGDVVVIGGDVGMVGAALLCAKAALHSGAGRVFVSPLDAQALKVDVQQPELMLRPLAAVDFAKHNQVLICGCGGGSAVGSILMQILTTPAPLVLDADALNAIAQDRALQTALTARQARLASTVLTPHPLEAARLLGSSATQVQNDRLSAAAELAARFACCVVLKGSGSVIAGPKHTPVINYTGNARLASAGSGDVLAGMIGAQLAAGKTAFDAACGAVYQHGALADDWCLDATLTAGQLAAACIN